MATDHIAQVNTLTFDIFGTVLDLGGSLAEPAGRFLSEHGSRVTGAEFWRTWRERQRIEQYQDNLFMLGHSGYRETCRRAFIYCLRLHGVEFDYDDVDRFMAVYDDLKPYDDAVSGLQRLADSGRYQLVALSNGEQDYLEKLARDNIGVPGQQHHLRRERWRFQAASSRLSHGGANHAERTGGDNDGGGPLVRHHRGASLRVPRCLRQPL